MKNILKILFFILFASLEGTAFAADKIVYVNTDCTFSGTGASSSCAISGGAAGAWKTCTLMVAGETLLNGNLTTLGGNLISNFSGVTADGQCIIEGFSGMDSTHLVKLVGNRTTGPTWDTAKHRISCASNGSGCLDIRDPYVQLVNMQVETIGSGSGNYIGLYSGSGSLYIVATGSIFRSADCLGPGGGGGSCNPVAWNPNVANTRNTFVNDFFIASQTATKSNAALQLYGSQNNAGEISIVYNDTFIGGQYGLITHGGGSGDAEYIKNNIAQAQWTAAYGLDQSSTFTTKTTSNNISYDTTSPDTSYRSKTCTFTSTTGGSEDLSLTVADTNCINTGADLSADAQYPFSTDIAGTTRPQGASWDIGAFEYVPSILNGSLTTMKVSGTH